MSIAYSDVVELIRRLCSESADVREMAADEVADLVRPMDDAQATILTGVLVAARLTETDVSAQESQLNALCELAEWRAVDLRTLDQLRLLEGQRLQGSQAEHYAELIGRLKRGSLPPKT